jgi:hypothetical protein
MSKRVASAASWRLWQVAREPMAKMSGARYQKTSLIPVHRGYPTHSKPRRPGLATLREARHRFDPLSNQGVP